MKNFLLQLTSVHNSLMFVHPEEIAGLEEKDIEGFTEITLKSGKIMKSSTPALDIVELREEYLRSVNNAN